MHIALVLLILEFDPATHKFSATVLMVTKYFADKILLSKLNSLTNYALNNHG